MDQEDRIYTSKVYNVIMVTMVTLYTVIIIPNQIYTLKVKRNHRLNDQLFTLLLSMLRHKCIVLKKNYI